EYTLKLQMHSGCHSGSNRHIVETADGSSRSSRMKRLISAHFGLMAALMLVMAPVQGFAAKEESTTATEKADNTEKTEKAENKKKKDKKKDTDAIGDRDVSKGVNFYSIEKEIALGKQVAQEIERQAKIIDDPVIAEYVNRVGQNLVRNSDVKVPVTIKVLDAEEVNAMALPAGFFFVNSGLILKAESESELAGVMAHEIAHIAGRHGTRQASRGQIINMASIPL